MKQIQSKKKYITAVFLLIIGWVMFFMLTKTSTKEIIPKSLIINSKINRGILYKKGLALDIYQPIRKSGGKLPVVVFIHGGGWNKGDKSLIEKYYRQYVLAKLLEDGICVISIDYTLVDESNHLSKSLQDCKDAIR